MKIFIGVLTILLIGSVEGALAETPSATSQASRQSLSLFGIKLGTLLTKQDTDKMECVSKSLGGTSIYGGPIMGWAPPAGQDVCYRADTDRPMGSSIMMHPYFNENVPGALSNIQVWMTRKGSVAEITKITIPTQGIRVQEEVYKTLTDKFGRPDGLPLHKVQNGFGVSFDAISAVWRFADGAILTFESPSGSINDGMVKAVSPSQAVSDGSSAAPYRPL